jgi:hypothetical protein
MLRKPPVVHFGDHLRKGLAFRAGSSPKIIAVKESAWFFGLDQELVFRAEGHRRAIYDLEMMIDLAEKEGHEGNYPESNVSDYR